MPNAGASLIGGEVKMGQEHEWELGGMKRSRHTLCPKVKPSPDNTVDAPLMHSSFDRNLLAGSSDYFF